MRHVLVVDDDPAICDVLKLGLEAGGTCRASTVTAVDDALRIIDGDRPDAAVVDAIMPPGPGGLVFASRAVDLGVPVLIVTGDPILKCGSSRSAAAIWQSPSASKRSPRSCVR